MNMYRGFRDAIHVPFIIATCNTELNPGDKVSLREDGDQCVKWGGKPDGVSAPDREDVEPMWHGVADPFRESAIQAGELFAVHIRKECFCDMRHDFRIEVRDNGGTSTCHSVCDIT